jgi:hypothetical protein
MPLSARRQLSGIALDGIRVRFCLNRDSGIIVFNQMLGCRQPRAVNMYFY